MTTVGWDGAVERCGPRSRSFAPLPGDLALCGASGPGRPVLGSLKTNPPGRYSGGERWGSSWSAVLEWAVPSVGVRGPWRGDV